MSLQRDGPVGRDAVLYDFNNALNLHLSSKEVYSMRIICTVFILLFSASLVFAFGMGGSLEITPVEPSVCGGVLVSGQSVRLTASGFVPSTLVEIQYQLGINTPDEKLMETTTDADGNLDVTVTVPNATAVRILGLFSAKGKGSNGFEKMGT